MVRESTVLDCDNVRLGKTRSRSARVLWTQSVFCVAELRRRAAGAPSWWTAARVAPRARVLLMVGSTRAIGCRERNGAMGAASGLRKGLVI